MTCSNLITKHRFTLTPSKIKHDLKLCPSKTTAQFFICMQCNKRSSDVFGFQNIKKVLSPKTTCGCFFLFLSFCGKDEKQRWKKRNRKQNSKSFIRWIMKGIKGTGCLLELWFYASRRALLSKHHKHTTGSAE